MSVIRSHLSEPDSAAASQARRPPSSTCLTPFTYEVIMDLARDSHIILSCVQADALKTFISTDPSCKELFSLIERIRNLDASQLSGAGLTDREKHRYNVLNDELEACKPDCSAALPSIRQQLHKNLDRIREIRREITNYRHIMLLYKTYLGILNDEIVWNESLADIHNEWSVQKHFACCCSEELLRLYEIYNNMDFNIIRFGQMMDFSRANLSIPARLAIQSYCVMTARQIKTVKMHAIASMAARLKSADRLHDLRYDDVIHDMVEKIEYRIGHRIIREDQSKKEIFDQLKVRRRQGLTYECCRQFVLQISKYCAEVEDHDSDRQFFRRMIQRDVSGLSVFTPPIGWCEAECAAVNKDPVVYFLVNQFETIKHRVLEKIMLEADAALALADQLDALIREARQCYQMRIQTNKKLKNPQIENKLDECARDFGEMLTRVQQCLMHQFEVEAAALMENVISGDFRGLPLLHALNIRINVFQRNYASYFALNQAALKCDLNFFILRYIDNHSGILSDTSIRERIAKLMAHYQFWPVTNSNMAEVETARKAVASRLGLLAVFYRQSFYHDRYSHFNWIAYFINEAAQPGKFDLERSRQLADMYHFNWTEFLPVSIRVLTGGDVIYVPVLIEEMVDAGALNNPKSTRRAFLMANRELIHDISEAGAYLINVVTPYAGVCPFLKLQSLHFNASFVKAMDRLTELAALFKSNIQAALGKSFLNYKMDRMLTLLMTHCDETLARVHRNWQRNLYENIQANMAQSDLNGYLRHESEMINVRNINDLITKIEAVFLHLPYQAALIDTVFSASAQILIDLGMRMLPNPSAHGGFQQYVSILERISAIEKFGVKIVRKLTDSGDIARLLNAHLDDFDGSQPVIGSLIATLFPPDRLRDTNALAQYILPYARKRLEYIRAGGGKGIQSGDLAFFNAYASVSECRALFLQERDYYERTVIDNVMSDRQPAWDPVTARVIEMFGSPADVSVYRARCVVSLMLNDKPEENDQQRLEEFKCSLFRTDFPLIDPYLFIHESGQSFRLFLDHYIDNRPWTEMREEIISLFDPALARQYHVRCIYQFLNNQAPLFGAWLQANLEYFHPFHLFGEDEAKKICEYVVSLILQAEKSCHDFNVDEDEYQSLVDMIQNLKCLRIFFHKMDNNAGQAFLEDVSSIEFGVTLAMLTKKLLRFLGQSSQDAVYDNKSIHELMSQLILVMHEVEKKEMVSFLNIEAYLNFLEKVLSNIPAGQMDGLRDIYIDGLLNFHLAMASHLKKILIILARCENMYLTMPEMLLSLANAIDDTDKIAGRRAFILESLDDVAEIRLVVEKIMALGCNINARRDAIHAEYNKRLLRDASIRDPADDPVALSIACVNKFLQIGQNPQLVPHYAKHVAKTLHGVMSCIPIGRFNEFAARFLAAYPQMTSIASSAALAGVSPLGVFNLWSESREENPALLQPVLKAFHLQFVAHAITASVEKYIFSKMKVKSGDPGETFMRVCAKIDDVVSEGQLPFVRQELRIDRDANARKVILLIRLHKVLSLVYTGAAKMDAVPSCIEQILDELSQKELEKKPEYYKAKEFKKMLEDALRIAKLRHIDELVQKPANTCITRTK
ncbi:hypothetical protein AQUSIP_09910 [Aquicella siphonis]|uniref:Uncharacterized protein n=1 Tax=Aquicella siphonis TaxID=254247 RepID=A0A5E4PHB0_9COXI|nr:hypothetical protein [Aquicella siphonis]VVC75701.1 hypothetical protein AQUSIP_09910 [Aquicella siphonis]